MKKSTTSTSYSPGFALVVTNNNKIEFESYSGCADIDTGEKITRYTPFRLASLSKQFTAMSITMLLEKGNIVSVNSSAELYFKNAPPVFKQITIKNLLMHSSGVTDYEKPLYKKIENGKIKELNQKDAVNFILKQNRLDFKPGTKFKYSEAGYVLLASIIEQVSGIKYSEFITKNIFEPLKMQNSFVLDKPDKLSKNRALGYKKYNNSFKKYDYDPLNYIVGNEGIYSCIEDLFKWQKAFYTNRLISVNVITDILTPTKLSLDKEVNYGLGWFIKERSKTKYIYHTGSWVGFNNIMLICPEKKGSVIFLSNTNLFPIKYRKKVAFDIYDGKVDGDKVSSQFKSIVMCKFPKAKCIPVKTC